MAQGLVSVRNYVLVTGAYWAFTLTDGALRMLVLLHFHSLGYSPFRLALLFLLYEVLGAVTNLCGGLLATRVGLKATLVAGLALQAGALLMLSGLSTEWTSTLQVLWVLAAQGLSGVAKDLTKLSAKSAIKLVVPREQQGALFRWVALLTGSKNALKGAGFFLGGALLTMWGFEASLWALAGFVAAALLPTSLGLPAALGRARIGPQLTRLFAKERAINVLSGARLFLFCARDVWFVVALPVFLAEQLGWSFTEIGTYMAVWVIGYGVVQTLAPKIVRHGPSTNGAAAAVRWSVALALSPLLIVGVLHAGLPLLPAVVGGLALFGVLFAVNSSIHSYLIVAYADAENVAADVGFYYMSNAIGRLVGTLLSGLIYQLAGLEACLAAAGAMVLVSGAISLALPDPSGHPAAAPTG